MLFSLFLILGCAGITWFFTSSTGRFIARNRAVKILSITALNFALTMWRVITMSWTKIRTGPLFKAVLGRERAQKFNVTLDMLKEVYDNVPGDRVERVLETARTAYTFYKGRKRKNEKT